MVIDRALPRRAAAELVGTAALVTVIIGSGLQAAGLSQDTGVQLLANALASAVGLGLLIVLLSPVSGAHLNPVITLFAWWSQRRGESPFSCQQVALYITAQLTGAVAGALLAETMFGRTPGVWSTQVRSAGHLLLGETVATAGLVLVVYGLDRIGRAQLAPVAVASYIGAAIWFTSSGSFANPAATVGRTLTDSLTGIAPASLPGFIAAQLLGGLLGVGLAAIVYGRTAARSVAQRPPETLRTVPVVYEASADRSQATAPAISEGSPGRPRGI
ncbi:aquaporin [Streptomyces sp. ISL-96]|nr:aquaporin [Streptomyces sp. ISL-96]